MCGTLAGHPLDTIKVCIILSHVNFFHQVRMQLETRNITTRQCAYEALVNEGAFSLYKGVTQPIIGATPINTM